MRWGEHSNITTLSLEEKSDAMIKSTLQMMGRNELPGQNRPDTGNFLVDWTWMAILKSGSSPSQEPAKARNAANFINSPSLLRFEADQLRELSMLSSQCSEDIDRELSMLGLICHT
jgi:hypothetical protein